MVDDSRLGFYPFRGPDASLTLTARDSTLDAVRCVNARSSSFGAGFDNFLTRKRLAGRRFDHL